MIWESDLPFYCNTFWLLVWTLGRENVLGACKVEGWGWCYVQSENACFGTQGKLRITHKKNLGLCLVPVAAHNHFPSPHHFSLHRSCSVHVLGQGTGRLRVLWHSVWSAHELWHLPSPRAGHSGHSSTSHPRQRWQLRDSPECAETQLTSQVRESWQRSVSCSASLNDSLKMHDFIFPCLPMLHGSQPLAGKPCRELLRVSWDYGARIMKFAKLRFEFRCRKEQREDVTEPCWERMVTPSTVLITCFGLPASLCSLGNCA